MRIAVAGGMSRSDRAGAATTARSDDLEFLAIRRVAPAGPRPPVPASAGWPQAESVSARARRLRAFASLPIVDVRRLARDERADFAAFLATLSPQQWQAPTLCGRWRVRDVVAHVISYDELAARGLLAHAGQSDGHHDTPAWLQWQFPIGRDHCGEVHAATEGLDQAAAVRRESSHSAREAPRGTLTRRRIERDPSPEPVLPHRGHPSRPTRSVARWAGPATPAAGRPAQRHGYGLTNMSVAADNTC